MHVEWAMDNHRMRALSLVVSLTVLGGCSLGPLYGGSPQPSPSVAPAQSVVPSPSVAPSPSEPSSSPAPSSAPVTGQDQALVRIENTGGFVPQEWLFTHYPVAVLYADGQLITQGATPDIYPGPALPGLVVTRLTQAGIAEILQAAEQAVLSGPDRTLGQPMPDVGQTIFTVVYADGTTHETTLYPEMGQPSPDPEIQALLDFESLLVDPHASLPDGDVGNDQPYDSARLRLISRPGSRDESPYQSLVTVKDWPLETLATMGRPLQQFGAEYRCVAISGDDLVTLLPDVQASNQLTLWRSDGKLYALIFHPLLPDDPDCPASDP